MSQTEALHSRCARFEDRSPLRRADSSEKAAIQCAYRGADGRRTCLLCRYLRGILNADIKKTKACVASPGWTIGRGRRLVQRQAGVAIALECPERTCAMRCARAVPAVFASTPREKHHAVLKAGRKNNVLSIASIQSRFSDFPYPDGMMLRPRVLPADQDIGLSLDAPLCALIDGESVRQCQAFQHSLAAANRSRSTRGAQLLNLGSIP